MRKKQKFQIPAVGGSLLLSIFAVLCLTVFAFLCLSTVLASKRLNDASVEAVLSYYEADYEAEEIFSKLRQGEIPDGVENSGDTYRYHCQISETQVLKVELFVQNDQWFVKQWQVLSKIK